MGTDSWGWWYCCEHKLSQFKICLSALSKQKCAFRFQSPIVFTSLSDIGSSTPPQNYCEDCSCRAVAMGAVSTVCWVAINMINCNNFDSKLPSCASMHKAQITCTGFLLVCDHCYTTCMFVIIATPHAWLRAHMHLHRIRWPWQCYYTWQFFFLEPTILPLSPPKGLLVCLMLKAFSSAASLSLKGLTGH